MPTAQTPAPKKSNLILIVAIIALIVLAAGAILLLALTNQSKNSNQANTNNPQYSSSSSVVSTVSSSSRVSADVSWSYSGSAWQANTTPPNCPEPMTIAFPADLSKATAILYPGQVRGGDYKAHGGARFDNSKNTDVPVSLPVDAKLIDGSRYIEVGEVQYMLDFEMSCGIRIRLDHLLTLAPDFQALVDAQLPAAKPDDSRTTNFSGSNFFAANTLVATAAGHTGNVAFDFGVYDLRKRNAVSQNATWAAEHANKASQAYYAVCWLDWIPAAQQSALQAAINTTQNKTSDYCK
jgi:hypothetical protein